VKEKFCHGDVLLMRRFIWRRFVEEPFCMCVIFSFYYLINSDSSIKKRESLF
jgi:hypothetical protein